MVMPTKLFGHFYKLQRDGKYRNIVENIGHFRYFWYISDIFDIFILQLDWVMSTERLVFKLYISEWGYYE